LYSYVRDDPVNTVDITGLQPRSLSSCVKEFISKFQTDVFPDVDLDRIRIHVGEAFPRSTLFISPGCNPAPSLAASKSSSRSSRQMCSPTSILTGSGSMLARPSPGQHCLYHRVATPLPL